MTALDAIMIIETEENASPMQQLLAWQTILNTRIYNELQGFYGRTVHQLLNAGLFVQAVGEGSFLLNPDHEMVQIAKEIEEAELQSTMFNNLEKVNNA